MGKNSTRQSTLLTTLVVSLLGLFIARTPVTATPMTPLARARAEYTRLRNVDPSGSDPIYRREWETLATRMRSVLTTSGSDPEGARFRLLSADTHLRLFRVAKERAYLTYANASLAPLVSSAAIKNGDPRTVAEALILMGDLTISGGGFDESAAAWYQQAAELPGPTAYVARERLQSLRNKTFTRFTPTRDLETPRPLANRGKQPPGRARPLIVIDPGHGGTDAGAIGPTGDQEKEITLDVARRVKLILEKRHGYRVLLTRADDRFVPLARRTAFANKKEAAAFISLHVNASVAHDADGLEAYYLDNTNDEASRKLAERENGVVPGADVDDLSFMLSDLIQSGKMESSIMLTRSVEGALRTRIRKPRSESRSLGVKKAPFFVLVGAHMPCSLIEMFFIDHPIDGKNLRQERFRSLLASGIADGVTAFLISSDGDRNA